MKIISTIILPALIALTGCDPEVAVQVEPRDGNPFNPGCAYELFVQGPSGCIQDATLCLDALIPTPCTANSPDCYDGFFKCTEAATECMKTNQP